MLNVSNLVCETDIIHFQDIFFGGCDIFCYCMLSDCQIILTRYSICLLD